MYSINYAHSLLQIKVVLRDYIVWAIINRIVGHYATAGDRFFCH